MKVALVGNMNNNNFSLLRYFKDLNVDTKLIMFKNDINKSQAHFHPANDTWNINKYSKDLIYIDFNDYYIILFKSRKYIRKLFSCYDIIICSGIIPIILERAKISIDIFYPYATGVEFIGSEDVKNSFRNIHFLKRNFYKYLARKQLIAVKKAKTCISFEKGITSETFKENNIEHIILNIPIIYLLKGEKKIEQSKELRQILNKISSYNFKLLCHTRHYPTKNLHILIEGFALFLKKSYDKKAWLIDIAKKVETKSNTYKMQLSQCREQLDSNRIWTLF